MSKKTTKIWTLAEYVRSIGSIKEPSSKILFDNKEIVFRGLSDSRFQLVPSLCRFPSPNVLNTLQYKELDLIEQAQLKFPSVFPEEKYPIFRLAKLQHYGIPTRLMDVTSNALVALYFACQENDQDGEVIAFADHILS